MKTLIAFLAAALFSVGVAQAAPAPRVEVRFFPAQQLWSHELDAARNLNTAVLHNTAIVNRGEVPVVVASVRFDLRKDGEVIQSRTLHASALDAGAKGGSAIAAAGLMDVLKFQFSPAILLGAGTKLSATRTLAPGEALYVPVQLFAFAGRPDVVSVNVDFEGDAPDVNATLEMQHGFVAGSYRFPLRGRWVAGAGATPHSHHRWAVPEEFAFDFVRYGASGSTYRGDGSKPSDYYAYAEPVLATADGEVVAVLDKMPDSVAAMRRPDEALADYQKRLRENQDALMAAGIEKIPGNHVLLRHGPKIHSVYGHLKPGSVEVALGDRVKAGQQIGAVGTSGNSTEPHLHFHVCDAPDALQCTGLPIAFDNIEIPFADGPRQIQSGDVIVTIEPPRETKPR